MIMMKHLYVLQVFHHLNEDMGLLMKEGLSCYLVLLSIGSKTG